MLPTFLVLLLSALLLLTLFRWRKARRIIRALTAAVAQDRNYLLDRDRELTAGLGLDGLIRAIEEKTESRRAVYKRSASQMDQIQTTFHHMRESAIVLDAGNRIQVCNPAAEQLLNWGKPIVESRIEQFLHSPEILSLIRRVRLQGVQPREQVELKLRGQSAWLEVSGAPLESADGEGRAMSLFLINDVTPLKKLEAIRKDFVANVSHELRTPITIIKGFAETLYEDGDQLTEARRKDFLEKVYRNSGRLHSLVEDLLALSRLESNSSVLNCQRVKVQGCIKEFAERHKELSPNTKLSLDLAPEPIYLDLDPVYFNLILQNLVANAERYGEIHTCITIRLQPHIDRDWVEVAVEDDGVGIPERERDRVFQRFYRVEKGRSSKKGGTGLGLSIVKHAVMAHGGTVEVRGCKPHGAIFICGFPRPDNQRGDIE